MFRNFEVFLANSIELYLIFYVENGKLEKTEQEHDHKKMYCKCTINGCIFL